MAESIRGAEASREPGAAIRAAVRARGVDVALALPSGRVTALVGANGAGKSTLVQLLSGELRPSAGTIQMGGSAVSDAHRHLPSHRRSVALLQQRPLLFPHLSVLDNVAFGPRARGASRAAARRRALAELDAVGAAAFADRRPESLSGGEAQRVALARALATDPTLLLLDEPFAALDVTAAASLRHLLRERLRGRLDRLDERSERLDPRPDRLDPRPDRLDPRPDRLDARPKKTLTTVLVTHDPLDLWALADRLVCLEGGRVVAEGGVAELLGRPTTGFLARLSGVNLLQGTSDGESLQTESAPRGGSRVTGLWDDGSPAPSGVRTLATFDPTAVALFREAPHGSPRNTWPVQVLSLDPRGATVRVRLQLGDGQQLAADLTAQGIDALGVQPGDRLVAQAKATQVTLYAR